MADSNKVWTTKDRLLDTRDDIEYQTACIEGDLALIHEQERTEFPPHASTVSLEEELESMKKAEEICKQISYHSECWFDRNATSE